MSFLGIKKGRSKEKKEIEKMKKRSNGHKT